MDRLMDSARGGSSFDNVRTFLEYVQGSGAEAESIPPAIVGDLREIEKRAQRVKAITGVMPVVEFSPHVLQLLETAGDRRAVAEKGVLNRIGA